MTRWHNLIVAAILIAVAWSCASLENTTSISLEVFRPAKLDIQPGKQNIGILYRNPVVIPDSAKLAGVSVPDEDTTGIYAQNPAAYEYIRTLSQLLKDSNRFRRIELIPANISEEQAVDSFKIQNITRDEIDMLRSQNPWVDIFFISEYINQQFFSYYYREISEFTMVVYTYSVWQIADLSHDSLTYQYFKTDTLWWQGFADSQKELNKNFPTVQQAMVEGADEAALAFARLFIPYWETVGRLMYLSGNYEMRIAQNYAFNNHWKEAADIWKKYTNNKNRRLAAKAMFNMALANEVFGEMEGAIDWAIKSYMVYNELNGIHSQNSRDYISKLVARKKEYEILDKAIKITDP